MSDITYEEILEDFIVFRTAFSKIFSIQDNLERLRDEYLPKSKHKQQLKKLVQINENQNKSLQERFKKLEEDYITTEIKSDNCLQRGLSMRIYV